jgi:hypothetical protein
LDIPENTAYFYGTTFSDLLPIHFYAFQDASLNLSTKILCIFLVLFNINERRDAFGWNESEVRLNNAEAVSIREACGTVVLKALRLRTCENCAQPRTASED